MKGTWAKIYAWLLLLLMLGGLFAVAYFAFERVDWLIEAVVGLALSLVLAPTLHELGHVVFALCNQMQVQYCKCFCFRYYRKAGKVRFGLCNPFAPDETQVVPKGSRDMQRRACAFAIGGLVFGGALLLVVLAACVLGWCAFAPCFVAMGALPYLGYLFFLNAILAEYPSGKTDAIVLCGLKKGAAAESVMLDVFRIHGELFTGKRFAEIDQAFYFSAPQLPMDEPLYVAILDLRYHYYLEREEYEQAFDCLKRIMAAREYLADEEIYDLEREIVYISLLGGNDEPLKQSTENDPDFWTGENVKAKRILALYAVRAGDRERATALAEQAKELLITLSLEGERKHEQLLIDRALSV